MLSKKKVLIVLLNVRSVSAFQTETGRWFHSTGTWRFWLQFYGPLEPPLTLHLPNELMSSLKFDLHYHTKRPPRLSVCLSRWQTKSFLISWIVQFDGSIYLKVDFFVDVEFQVEAVNKMTRSVTPEVVYKVNSQSQMCCPTVMSQSALIIRPRRTFRNPNTIYMEMDDSQNHFSDMQPGSTLTDVCVLF